jgi:UDP:flavonoid glycosyltransferase YjiC (YdhE family)
MLAIATALRARGADVVIGTHGGPHESLLAQADLPVERLSSLFDGARSAQFVHGVTTLGHDRESLLTTAEVRSAVAAEVDFFRRVSARIAVTGFTVTSTLSTRVVRIPLVTTHGGSFVPPVFERWRMPTPTRPPDPAMHRLPRPLWRLLANLGPPRLTAPTAFLNTVARELQVDTVPTLAALMCGDLTLVTEDPELLGIDATELANWRPRGRAYRASTRLVATGPLYATLDVPIPDDVERMLSGPRPTCYVALTSSSAQLVRDVVAQVRAAGFCAVVASTIHALHDLAAEDVTVTAVLPSHRVAPRVQLAVIMGGQGSVQTMLAAGTPFVGVPLHMEQELNVGIAARHGAAVPLSIEQAGTPALAAALRRLHTEPSWRAAARRVAARYAGIDGAGRAADEILKLDRAGGGSVR